MLLRIGLVLATLAAGCRGRPEVPLVKRLLIDAHIDVPYRLRRWPEDIAGRTEHGDFDLPRARAGGLSAAFFAVFVPPSRQKTGGARALADELIDGVEAIVRDHPDELMLVRSPAEVQVAAQAGRFAIALGLENGAALEGQPANVRHFRDRGVRYVTLVHAKDNDLADSSFDDHHTWKGLSPAGRAVVAEMSRLGVMVDVSHLSDDSVAAVLDLATGPVIASHSSCRHFVPGLERDLSDEQIRRIAATGGVVMVNFSSSFLDERAWKQARAAWDAVNAFVAAQHLEDGDPRADEFLKGWYADHSRVRANVATIADHIDHVVAVAGIDSVGIGSDFDGIGEGQPEGLKDVSQYPALFEELRRRGYDERALEKIAAGNLLRVWARVQAGRVE